MKKGLANILYNTLFINITSIIFNFKTSFTGSSTGSKKYMNQLKKKMSHSSTTHGSSVVHPHPPYYVYNRGCMSQCVWAAEKYWFITSSLAQSMSQQVEVLQ